MKAKLFAMGLLCVATTLPAFAADKSSVAPLTQATTKATKTIDLNHATLTELTHSFKGIGAGRAKKIIAYREAHHGFKSLEELGDVSGIGQNFVASHLKELQATFSVG